MALSPDTRFLYRLSGLSILLFPVMLLVGFLMHPDLLSFVVVERPGQLVENFHHQWLFHYGHLLVALAIPFITISVVFFAVILREKAFGYGWIGGMIALVGATVLGLDKGSLCLVLAGFDTLPEAEFQGLVPYLQVLIDKPGLLGITWLIALLPLGAIIQTLGLIRAKVVSQTGGILIILGLLLLNNPDIELISSAGAILMITGYAPLGWKYFRAQGL